MSEIHKLCENLFSSLTVVADVGDVFCLLSGHTVKTQHGLCQRWHGHPRSWGNRWSRLQRGSQHLVLSTCGGDFWKKGAHGWPAAETANDVWCKDARHTFNFFLLLLCYRDHTRVLMENAAYWMYRDVNTCAGVCSDLRTCVVCLIAVFYSSEVKSKQAWKSFQGLFLAHVFLHSKWKLAPSLLE